MSFVNGMPRAIPYEFNKDKRNWMYVKPEWCPLKETETADNIIETIDTELDKSSSCRYVCADGSQISTDVGYVQDWWNEYKDKLKRNK